MTRTPASSPSSFEPPPHGLRLVTLHDRLVVHDITFALRRRTRSSTPSASALAAVNRNALIDAANSIPSSPQSPSRHHHHRPRLVDLPSPDAPTNYSDDPHHHRYLVFPFATAHAPCDPPTPYECATPEAAGLIPSATNNTSYPGDGGGLSSRHNNAMMHHQTVPPKVDAVAAFIGTIPLHSAVYVIVATQIRHVATLPCGPVLAVTKVSLLPLLSTSHAHLQGAAATAAAATTTSSAIASAAGAGISKEDRDTAASIAKLLESGSLYYSVDTDLCRPYGWSTNDSSAYSADANNNQSNNINHHQFHWNFPLLSRLPSAVHSWAPLCIYGFVSEHHMSLSSSSMSTSDYQPSSSFHMALVSRRSRRRAGTRFITRGVDAMGDVANFVETEQLVWPANDIHKNSNNMLSSSFTIIRGSIPVFWRQNNGIARPAPELDAGLAASRRAFAVHFDALRNTYGDVCAVSLVNKHGAEGMLAQAFDRHHQLYCCYSSAPFSTSGEDETDGNDNKQKPSLVAFDFHAYCAGKEYERGLSLLMNRLQSDVQGMGFNVFDNNGSSHSTTRYDHPGRISRTRTQTGVFRVNCVDCLDRTNVVQTMICREILQAQLQAVVTPPGTSLSEIRLSAESEDRFKHVWGDHADAISKQYSGTGALKTDFTRTGKRSTTGVIGDGVKSVMRMYYKNFVDESRQEVIDMVCGNAVIRQQVSFASSFPSTMNNKKNGNSDIDARYSHRRRSASDHHIIDDDMTKKKSTGTGNNTNSKPTTQSSLWYSFDAMRINAGGDKQAVMVELHDNVMYVTTSDGLCFEYPRHSLVSWDKASDGDGRGGGGSGGGSGGVSGSSGGGAAGVALSSDRRGLPSRLRLIYRGSYASPASAMPLDLLFRGGGGSGGGGMTARENFLRALLSWAAPPCTRLMSTRTSLRVRVLVATDGIGEHVLSDWGLGEPPRTRRGSNNSIHRNNSRRSSVDASDDGGRRSYEDVHRGVDDSGNDDNGAGHEIVFLIIPNVSAASRGCGLAAVPNDVGDVRFHEAPSLSSPPSPSSKCRHLVLISAFALSERGPAVAVLASPAVAPTVMGVEEATWLSSTSSYSSSFATSQHGNALNHGQPQHSFAQNGVAAVGLQACGMSICVVAARLSSKAQVYAALLELRLGKPGYDLTAQYDHFVMTGLMGDNPWSLPSASLSASTYDASSFSSHGARLDGQPERPQRQWMQLDDGSLCHALTNGVSVRRHSLPTLRYDDLLFQQQEQKPQKQPHNPSPFVCCVCDGVVDGKPSPALPKQLCRAVVTVSQLHAENVKIPRGVESSSQMNCSVVLSCALATTDMVTTRPSLRPTTFPDWSDVLTLQMTPSDVDDVMRAFLFGQVVVPNVLGDPFVAGSFVVPLATAPSGFDVRCRLGGHVTARLVGHVDVDTTGGGSDGGNGEGVESYQEYNNDGNRWSNERQNSSHNRHSNELSKTQSSSISTMSARAAEYAAGLNQLALKKSSGIAMDDVNQRIEQARKKGARQMKSAFNKLSALMSASSLSSSASSPPPFSAAGAGVSSLSSSSSSSMNNARSTTSHMTSMLFQQQQEQQPGNQHQAFQQRHENTGYVTRAEQGGCDEILQQHQQYTPTTAAAAAVSTRTPQQAQRQMETRTRITPRQVDESGELQRPDITSTTVQSGGVGSAAAAAAPSYSVDAGDGNRYSSSVTSTSSSSIPMRTPKSPSSVTTRRVASPGVDIITGDNNRLPSRSTTADAGHHASTTVSNGTGADALLLGLAETKTSHTQSSAATPTVAATGNPATSATGSARARHADFVPLHVSSSSTTHDPLLSGLAAQKQKNAPQVSADDDDGWGDFTSA